MVVEDDPIVSTLVQHLLFRYGYDTCLVTNGQAAADMIDKSKPPQLVMIDVMLPFMDGFELISRIRTKDEWSKVPIIMLTSKTQEGNIVRALESGADDYITKPFNPQELISRVRRFIK